MPAPGPRPDRGKRRWAIFWASALAAVAVAGVLIATPWNNPWAGNPLGNTRFFTDPNSSAALAAAASGADAARAQLLGKIADQPSGIWLTGPTGAAAVRGQVRHVLHEAAAQQDVPIFVLYAYPFHGCTAGLDEASSTMAASYHQWIEQVSLGIGTSKAVLVVEPDALPEYATLGCLSAGQKAVRLAVLRAAVARLARLPHAVVYLDAGNARWHPVSMMARLLRAAGVLAVRGFALNVSNFDPTSAEASYGDQLSARLDNAHFVIDTSRNGVVGTPPQTWCNPPDQALGLPPTANTPDPRVDAWLWIKQPGASDGTCGGGPPAGTFWPAYAISLAANAPW